VRDPAIRSAGDDLIVARGWQPDYAAVRRQADLRQTAERDRDLVIAAAARLGRTRLIDNVEVLLRS